MSLKRRARQGGSLWRTATIRLAIVFASIFGVGATALLILLDIGIARFAQEEVHSALRHQMAIMRADAQIEGGAALAKVLAEHVRTDTVNRYRYLVVPTRGAPFNSGIPEAAERVEGFGRIEVLPNDLDVGNQGRVGMLVLTERLPDGTLLVVGRESLPLDDLRSVLNRVAFWSSVALILLAIAAGMIAGSMFLRRLELVSATTGRIIDGNLSERLPPIGFGQEFHDLTRSLNTMLDRLEVAMGAMRQISTDLAHDLRMPLTRLRNRLEEIQPTTHLQAAQIEDAMEEADQLLSLFNSMLRIARLEAGSVTATMAPIDLSQLVQRAVEAYQPAAEEGGRKLVCKLTEIPSIVGDAALLSQLIANLIDNGLSHTPRGALIDVEVGSTANTVFLIVNDDGPGAPEAALADLTKRFFRVDQSRTQPGAGLGLTLVAAIADLHQAKMTIRNREPGLSIEVTFSRSEPG
jgi:signal transduction histidine kinase